DCLTCMPHRISLAGPEMWPKSTQRTWLTESKKLGHTDAVNMLDERVAQVRAFTRFFTAVMGVLDEGLLQSPYSLTEARVIFELAQADRTESLDVRTRLGLDPGYLSRILARFEADGLVVRERSGTDSRRQVVRLTPAGREVYAMLDARSSDQVRALLDGLSEDEQSRVLESMAVIRSVLGGRPRSRSFAL